VTLLERKDWTFCWINKRGFSEEKWRHYT